VSTAPTPPESATSPEPVEGNGASTSSAGASVASSLEPVEGNGALPPDAQAASYRCPNCGSTIAYQPGTTQLTCPSCGTAITISAGDGRVEEHDYAAWAASAPKPVAAIAQQSFRCSSCGAATESDQLAGACPFCGGALVALGSPEGLIVPEAVVPFKLDKPAATTAFGAWIGSRWFAPNALKRLALLHGGLQGVYAPHWTYDAQTATAYHGRRGVDRTVSHTVRDANGNTRTETRIVTDWYPASGHVQRSFDDVLVPGTTKVVPEYLAELAPWGLDSAVPYAPEYLVGYAAARYDVDPNTGLEEAKRGMAQVIEGACRRDIGGDHQQVTSMQTAYSELMFKLILLPIWIAAYTYRGTSYQVIVNAQTGEVLGRRPYSAVKIALAVLAGLLVVAGIITAIVLLGHGSSDQGTGGSGGGGGGVSGLVGGGGGAGSGTGHHHGRMG
jgi:predicted RNA-binding Zn-ribbon protein involved in translation (DUF1610 family)